jgi:DNA-binding phage protein
VLRCSVFGEGDSGAVRSFVDSEDDRHISDSRTVHGVEEDLNERSRRLLAAAEAKTAGYGGIAAASRATGIARSTIGRGLKDLAAPSDLSGEVRRPGGGCPTLIEKDPGLLEDLRRLVEPATMGDPTRRRH